MIFKRFFTFSFLTVYFLSAMAQPVLIPLQSNVTIEKYKALNGQTLRLRSDDTLALPFIDDFAKYTIYPDQSKWIDEDVFINTTYGVNPPTIGVATFDMLNSDGYLHTNASAYPFISDFLTSKPINLFDYTIMNPISVSTTELFYYQTSTNTYHPADSLYYQIDLVYYNCMQVPITFNVGANIFFGVAKINVSDSLYTYDSVNDIYVHIEEYLTLAVSPADSVWFSFYYQPKGLGGNAPEASDSLILEFKDSTGIWKHIWSTPGTVSAPFKQIMICIDNGIFFYKGFQFRFKNYAGFGTITVPSFASNGDMWNLDLVKIDKNRFASDTIHNDITFVYNIDGTLNNFTAVPWNHFKAVSGFKSDTIDFIYRNMSDSTKIVTRKCVITDKLTGDTILSKSLGSENISPFSDSTYLFIDTTQFFNASVQDYAEFEIQFNVTSSTPAIHLPYRWNDTLKYNQVFDNYYAYDDGIPEYGFGLAGNTTENGQVAFKFYTLTPDTIRGIYMFFNRTLNNANQKYFYLTVWDDSNGKPGTILRKYIGQKPEFHGLNEFHYYSLDTSIYITGTFYIGWVQTTQDLLNIGFDFNYDASSKVFFNIDGYWENIPFAGTPMMRPVLSQQPIVYVSENPVEEEIKVYPNPARNFIYIDSENKVNIRIYNMFGEEVTNAELNNNMVDVSRLKPGLYILKIFNGIITVNRKIVISR